MGVRDVRGDLAQIGDADLGEAHQEKWQGDQGRDPPRRERARLLHADGPPDSGAATTVADYRAYAGRGAVRNVMNVRRGPSGKS